MSNNHNIFGLLMLVAAMSGPTSFAQSSHNYISTTERHDGGGTLTTYQYYDEAGRPSGTVQVGVTPDGSNLMDMTEYDGFGREKRQWLPVATPQTDMTSSDFQSAATSGRQDSRPYVETAYEASSLSRPLSETGQGTQWATHPKKTEYMFNTSSFPLSCKDYYVRISGTLSDRGAYPADRLRVIKLTDEDGHVCYEFRDLQDRLLLRRRMLSTSSSADTYYAYDIRGDLRYVLQPEYQRDNDLGRFTFQYDYDSRHNVIRRKVPGASEQRLVYDRANRLTFSQDGNQHARGRMSFLLYDDLGRGVLQGECDGTEPPDLSGTIVTTSFSLTEGIGGTGYTSDITLNNVRIEQAHYYDTYVFLSLPSFCGAGFTAGEVSARGQETGSIVAVLPVDADVSSSMPSPASLLSAYHYDIKGRQTLSQATNMLGGKDVTSTEYGYLLPARTVHTHTADGQPTQVMEQTYSYDHADRLTSSSFRLNGGETMILHTDGYDDYGRLSAKRLMDREIITYSYNIRDWLTQITSENFTEDLFYHNGPTKPCFNGDIIWQRWKVGSEPDLQRNFLYNYDDLDRLTCATYGEGMFGFDNRNRYTTRYTYDKNGNMLSLKRNGLQDDGSYSLIDDMAMQYDGNQITLATDDADGPFYAGAWHFRDGADEDEEYQYDENGNLTQDLNSNISLVEYNFLNLPSRIEFMDGSSARYTYDATGRKLRAEYLKAGTQDTLRTDYCGNLIYEQGRPHMLLVDGGYVTFNVNDNVNDSMQWHYYLKDHLGNNRVVVNTNDSIEQVNHYYPYGGLMAGSIGGDAQRYKYNGKELDRMHGLDWMDYGARWMNGLTFTTPDPKAWDYTDVSPYAYCHNNPVNRIDPDGMDDEDKIVGYVVGTITNVIPFSGFMRDSYTPNDSEDYNDALHTTDKVASGLGKGMVAAGGTSSAIGGTLMGGGMTATVTSGGTAFVASVPATAIGGTLMKVGAILGLTGATMNANSNSNKSAGYERGKKSNVSSGNKNSQHANQKRRNSAEEKYNIAREKYNKLSSKSKKTHDDVIQRDRARKEMEHWKSKMDFNGENHSKNAKGNRR